jgi:hypothetical protein
MFQGSPTGAGHADSTQGMGYTERMNDEAVGYTNSVTGRKPRLSLLEILLDGLIMLLTVAVAASVILGVVALFVVALELV